MIVAKEGRSFVADYPTSFAMLLGRFNGLNLQGENWKRLRRYVVSTIMRVDLLKGRMADVEDLVVKTLDSWTDDGRTIFVEDETKTVILFSNIGNIGNIFRVVTPGIFTGYLEIIQIII